MKTSLVNIFGVIVFSVASFANAQQASPTGYATLEQYSKPKAPAPGELKRFSAPSGAAVKETLERWSTQAGWNPVAWGLPEDTDFILGAPVSFNGDVGIAAESLIKALGSEADLTISVDKEKRVITVSLRN